MRKQVRIGSMTAGGMQVRQDAVLPGLRMGHNLGKVGRSAGGGRVVAGHPFSDGLTD